MPLVSGIPLFVVPRRNQATLCTVEHRRLVEVNPVPVPIYDEYNVHTYEMNENGWIVWIHPEDLDSIGCFHSDAEPSQRFPPIPLPAKHEAKALVFNRDVLYVAGDPDAGLVDFSAIAPEWQALPSVEALDAQSCLTDDGRYLISGEQEVWNLALHSLDVTAPRHPVSRRRQPIFRFANTESFTRIAHGGGWLAVLLLGYGFGGEWTYILLCDPFTLQEYGHLSVTLAHPVTFSGDPIVNPPQWSDIAFQDDVLFIAAGSHGVGVLDLCGLEEPAQPRRSREDYNREFCELCESRLFYVPLPEGVSGSVVRIFPVPTTGQVLAVLRAEQMFDSVLLDVPRRS